MKKIVCIIATAAAVASAFTAQAATEPTQPALQGEVLSTSKFYVAGKSYDLPRLRRADGAICQVYVSGIDNAAGVATPTMSQWCDKALSFVVKFKSPTELQQAGLAVSGLGQDTFWQIDGTSQKILVKLRALDVKGDGTVRATVSYSYDEAIGKKVGSVDLEVKPGTPVELFVLGDMRATISLDK